jgi:predicted RNA-binding protein
MAYYTDLFTVETYRAFLSSDKTVSGFRESQRTMAKKLKRGDKMLAYLTGLSRWAGVLEVVDGPYEDRTPIFYSVDDPFIIRFKVNARIALPLEHAFPIQDTRVFDNLSFTRGKREQYWLGPLRRSLQHITDEDGRLLEGLLTAQAKAPQIFPIDADVLEEMEPQRVKRADGDVRVVVPKDIAPTEGGDTKAERESIRMQAEVARLGEAMGCRIWLPRNDRAAVLTHWKPHDNSLIDSLPLNYDETTIKTIEQIDVIWLKGRAIQRAFEVEHSTAVYSGLLRMADLLALQPNMNIALHIVAPAERREKVLAEIRRPVFSLLEHQPLAKNCSFISYEDLTAIMALPHLSHYGDSVVSEYEDRAD